MPVQQYLNQIQELLRKAVGFSSIPLSILLIGLEAIIDQKFVCPCVFALNYFPVALIFIGPSLFTFALMCILLRPCRYGCCRCVAGPNEADDVQQNCPRAFASCLIPPVMWIFILLLDGDYLACALTGWEGNYVFDEELKIMWCKPTNPEPISENELQQIYQRLMMFSQTLGYVLLSVVSVLIVIFVCGYDCIISGKSCCTGTNSGTPHGARGGEHKLVQREPVADSPL